MDKNALWKWLILLFLAVWSLSLVTPIDQKVKLGLDLKGGTSFVLQVAEDAVKKQMLQEDESRTSIPDSELKNRIKEALDIAIEIVRNRVDNLGVAEAEIYPEGYNRIVVRLPGVDAETRAEAKAQISRDAVLNFKLVHKDNDAWVSELIASGKAPFGYKLSAAGPFYIRDRSVPDELLNRDTIEAMKKFGNKRAADFMLMEDTAEDGSTIYRPMFIERRKQLGGDTIKNAYVTYDPMTNLPKISLELNKEGAKKFGSITEAYGPKNGARGRRLAIILDGKLYSAPYINEPIYSGRAEITGRFTVAEARRLVNVLRAGALPVPVQIIEERTVAPTLGQDSINSGIRAVIYGGIAVVIFMAVYYMLPGVIADLSLLVVMLLLPVGMTLSAGFLGVLSGSLEGSSVSLPTLTLPGIAGIVLTIGMAVDANVLIFERMREESSVGKSLINAVNAGYNKAFSTILDANITTLLTAAILFWQGSGPIRGFAVTLSAGIIVSMFVVLVITRLFFTTLAEHTKIDTLKMLCIIRKTNIDFIGKRVIAATLSTLLIIGTWTIFVKKGEKNFGVDFTGGTVMTFEFDQKQPIEKVRSALDAVGFGNAKIAYQASLDNSAKEYLEVKVSEDAENAEPALTAIKSLPGNYRDIQKDSVGSQIGSELKRQSIKAIIFALLGIIIYISIRFEFAFAVGAIVALAHDVLITVGLYCALGRELNMPIIAALLTIVGYSVNDTIVVFDRIREDLRLIKGKSYKEIANMSINQTLSRTLLTSLTTLLTVIMLLIFGGGAINDFALTLFIGILVGTYSSVFVATPVVLLWHKEEKV